MSCRKLNSDAAPTSSVWLGATWRRRGFWLCLWAGWVLLTPAGCGYFSNGETDPAVEAVGDPGLTAEETPGTTAGPTHGDHGDDDAGMASFGSAGNAALEPLNGLAPVDWDSLRPLMVGSWTLKATGQADLDSAAVTSAIGQTVRPFDVLALQGVVHPGTWLTEVIVQLNQAGPETFNYVLGPPQGPVEAATRLAFIYDSSRVRLLEQPFVFAAQNQRASNPPLVARFQVRLPDETAAFSFVMINWHPAVEPPPAGGDATVDWLDRLESLYADQEEDFLVAGPSAPVTQSTAGGDRSDTNRVWQPVWTAGSHSGRVDLGESDESRPEARSNLYLRAQRTGEFLGRSGSLPWGQQVGVSSAQLDAVAANGPVWAGFSLLKSPRERSDDPQRQAADEVSGSASIRQR